MQHAHRHHLIVPSRVAASPRGPSEAWLRLTGFAYDREQSDLAVLQLLGRLEGELGAPTDAMLIVEHGRVVRRHGAWSGTICPEDSGSHRPTDPTGRLWTAYFSVPLEVVESPRALFKLQTTGRLEIALPSPELRLDFDPLSAADAVAPRFRIGRIRRNLVALGAGFAVAAACGTATGGALAGTTPTVRTTGSSVTDATTTTATTTTTTTTPTTTTPTTTTPTTPTIIAPPAATTPTTPCPPTATPPTATAPAVTTPTVTTACPPVTTTSPTPAPAAGGPGSKPKPGKQGKGTHGQGKHAGGHQKPNGRHGKPAGRHGKPAGRYGKPAGRYGKPVDRHGKPVGRHGKPVDRHGKPAGRHGKPIGQHGKPGHNGSGAGKHTPGVGAAKHRHVGSTATPLTPSSASTGLSVSPGSFSLDPFYSAQLARASSMIGGSDQPPAFLIPIYKAAGRRYDVPWRILAAINAIETDFGRNLNVSSAGAIGWMQFMPSTWRQYGAAVDGRGRPNPYDPRDAIFAAAHYLAVAGAGHDLRGAVFAYNHALWYVDAVLWRASTISDSSGGRGAAATGYALPIDGRYMHQIGRTDDGVDLEAAPDGAAVYSITPGVVTAVASDPSGFGPNYPVVLVTAGPLAGEYIYYGHVAASLVHAGEHVRAGQPIAVMGHTGDAASLGHGHIEIGFSGASGNPIDHHSGVAWTPAGAAMRHVITSLSSGFGIKNS